RDSALSLHDALPICREAETRAACFREAGARPVRRRLLAAAGRASGEDPLLSERLSALNRLRMLSCPVDRAACEFCLKSMGGTMSTIGAAPGTRQPLAYLHEQLEELKAKGLYFRLRVLESKPKGFTSAFACSKANKSRWPVSTARRSSTSARTITSASPRTVLCAVPRSKPRAAGEWEPERCAPLPAR